MRDPRGRSPAGSDAQMAQIFHPAANALARATLFAAAIAGLAGTWILGSFYRPPYVTQAGVIREQPVPFSHKHHVGEIGMDCRYCHTSVEESGFAGIPPTRTCINCHFQVWAESPLLEPVRRSWREGVPLAWSRVHRLADFVYFNHSIHLKKGVGCVTYHGQVDQMPLLWQEASLFMEWCLECHREPERFVRPLEAVYRMDEKPRADQLSFGKRFVAEMKIRSSTDCADCHVREGRQRTWIIIGAGVFWLLLLLGLGMTDFIARSWLPSTAGAAGEGGVYPPAPAPGMRERP
jgi:hypothetical protein